MKREYLLHYSLILLSMITLLPYMELWIICSVQHIVLSCWLNRLIDIYIKVEVSNRWFEFKGPEWLQERNMQYAQTGNSGESI